jgi:hypothetical protein
MTDTPARVINLRMARKARARATARAEGTANAARFGRSTAERSAQETAAETAARRHEAHRRGAPGHDPDASAT